MTDTVANRPRGAHLVGSVPLADSEAVFREVSARLAGRLRRVPDGETGIRTNWIQWQFPLLLEVPEFEAADERPGPFGARLQLREGVDTEQVEFPELGYRAAAVESYEVFSRLKRQDVIGADVRFQVCLPTPLAVIHVRFIPRDQDAVEQAYERQLLKELDGMLDVIPPGELAIQWDTAVEFAILEGLLPSFVSDAEAEITERLVRLGNRVPSGVETGYHLCYGDVEHQHFIEPVDMTKLVAVANGVCAPALSDRSTGSTCRSPGSQRRRLLRAAQRFATSARDRTLSRTRASDRWRRWNQQAHRCGSARRRRFWRSNRVRLRPASGGDDARAA